MGLKSGLKMSAIALGLFLGLWIAPFFVSLILTNYNAGALEKAIVPGMPWSEVARALDASRKWSFLHFGSKDGRLCGSVFFRDGTYSFVASESKEKITAHQYELATMRKAPPHRDLKDDWVLKQATACPELRIFFMGIAGYRVIPVQLSSGSVVSVGSIQAGP